MTNEKVNVPELRFPGFEGEWEENKLGDLADIVRGASPRPINDPRWFDNSSEVGWLRISDVTKQNGKIYKLEQKISEEGQKKTRVLKSRHLLLSIAASVGKPVMNYVSTGVHDGFLIFLKPKFNIEFMFQWLDNFQEKWQKYGQPGSQVNLNSELVKSQKIYLPESEEQLRISDFFSKLDRQIELEEQKLVKLEQQKKGYMQKIFSQQLRFKDENGNDYPDWEEKELYKILDKIIDNRGKTPEVNNVGSYPLLEVNALGYYNPKYDKVTKYINYKTYVNWFRDHIEKDDILFSTVGKTGIVSLMDDKKGAIAQNIVGLRVNQNNDSNFIYFMLSYWENIKKIKRIEMGAVQPSIKVSQFKYLLYSFPSYKEQQKIGNFLFTVDKLIMKSREKISLLNNFKQACLQKMFI
jgi:type I restriction enzyme S subunit